MLGKKTSSAELALGPAADDEQAAVEGGLVGDVVARADEELADLRRAVASHLAGGGLVDRHLAPADRRRGRPRATSSLIRRWIASVPRFASRRTKHIATARLPGAREDGRLGVDLGRAGAEELVRQTEHDPGAVAGRFVGARGPAVLEPVEGHQRPVDRLVDRDAVEAGDAGDAAAVVEVRRDRGRRRSRLRCVAA